MYQRSTCSVSENDRKKRKSAEENMSIIVRREHAETNNNVSANKLSVKLSLLRTTEMTKQQISTCKKWELSRQKSCEDEAPTYHWGGCMYVASYENDMMCLSVFDLGLLSSSSAFHHKKK